MKILLIDDHKNSASVVDIGLTPILGKTFTLVFLEYVTTESDKPGQVMEKLTAPEFLEMFDLVLLDLELKGNALDLADKTSYHPDDLQGGSVLLPRIREIAPWLPVIGFSQLLDVNKPYWLSIIASFGFDAIIGKKFFESRRRDFSEWSIVFEGAKQNRRRMARGFELAIPSGRSVVPTVDMDPSLEDSFEDVNHFRELVISVFGFATRVTLIELQPGFSGARVFSANVQANAESGARVGHWLLKTSKEIAKISAECQAHSSAFRLGLPFARFVPLMWPGVIVEHGTAAIAYQFAASSSVATGFLRSEGLAMLGGKLKTLLQSYYQTGISCETSIISTLLLRTLPSTTKLEKSIEQLPDWVLGKQIRLLLDRKSSASLNRNTQYSSSLIHRDLHLGNVLLGERDVVIDFALSAVGPIAFDYARMVADILLNVPEMLEKVTRAESTDPAVLEIIELLGFHDIARNRDDTLLLSIFLEVIFAQLLRYREIDSRSSKEIERILLNSCPTP